MTIKTRRRVFISLFLLALTLPAETILLKALQSPNDKAAAKSWVASLDSAQLAGPAANIQSYPFAYRQSIMARLSPSERSSVWQGHVQQYIQAHPQLDGGTLDVLRAAQSALTPRALSEPTAEDRASLNAVAGQVEALLGRDEALFLLHQLGPADGKFASAEPFSMKLASLVRSQFVVSARDGDCDCAGSFGCSGYHDECSSEEYCSWDVVWPMCGWGWGDVCDGQCRIG